MVLTAITTVNSTVANYVAMTAIIMGIAVTGNQLIMRHMPNARARQPAPSAPRDMPLWKFDGL
eukprot:4826573-Pyramimonas_sp.AAC.1